MVTYVLEKQERIGGEWLLLCGPLTSRDAVIRAAALERPQPESVMRIRAMTTAVDPDGSIVRRYLDGDELEAAIRGEQVTPKPVKAVVFASDIDGRDALYVDGELYRQMSLGEDDDLGVIDCVDAAGGSLVKLEARWIQREIAAWPKRLADLRLDD